MARDVALFLERAGLNSGAAAAMQVHGDDPGSTDTQALIFALLELVGCNFQGMKRARSVAMQCMAASC